MKKRLPVLLLALALVINLLPAAGAADLVYFPEFSAVTGGDMVPSEIWPGVDSSLVPTQTYFGTGLTVEDCLSYVQTYISALEDTGEFEVVWPLDVTMGREGTDFVGYGALMRYTGPVGMKGTLLATRAEMNWGSFGEYHLDINVEHNAFASNPDKENSVTIRWDSALRPEGIDDGSGPMPAEGSGKTVVLAIGYNKMAVGDQVVLVDDYTTEVTPVNVGGRTLVPVACIVGAFGGTSSWDGATQTATFTLNGETVTHVVGTNQVTTPTGVKTMEVPSMLMNGRTYIPVRFVLEGLGLWVGWEPTYQLVIVSTEDLSAQNFIKLDETQRLFASEIVPETPRKIIDHYTIDGYNYTMEVGEALTLFNSQTAISGFSAYSWDVLEGGELVKVDRDNATCRFYAKRPGVVTIQSHLDETVVNYFGPSTHNEYTYTMTITIVPPTAGGSSGGMMHYQTCPYCNGTGKIQVGSRLETCPRCNGDKIVLQ